MRLKRFFLCIFTLLSVASTVAQSWQARFSVPSDIDPDPDLSNICALSSGNSLVSGSRFGLNGDGALLLGLSPEGNVLWRRGYERQGVRVSVFDMYPLPNGNALVLFSIGIPQPFSVLERILIAEVSGVDGAIVWQRYPGSDSIPGYYSRAVIAPDGIFLGGRSGDFVSVVKLDFGGGLIWQKTFNDGSVSVVGEIADLALAPNGQLYAVTRHFVPLTDASNFFSLMKFTDAGDVIWAKRYRIEAGARTPVLSALSLSEGGDPIILGSSFLPGPVSQVPFFLRTNPDGELLSAWRRAPNPTGGNTRQNIIPLGNDEFLLAFDGTSRAFQYVRYSLSAGVKWTRYYETSDLGYVHYKTARGIDGYLYTVCQRLNLVPLERISVVSRADDLLFGQASCCLKEGDLEFNDYINAFESEPVAYTPQPDQWVLENAAIAFNTVNPVRSFLCQASELDLVLSDTVVCAGGCISAQSAMPNAGALIWRVAGKDPITADGPVELCFDQPGSYEIAVESANDACRRTMVSVRVFAIAAPEIAASDSLICPGECVRYSLDTLLPGYAYAWSFEGGTPAAFTGDEPPEICYGQSGVFEVKVQIVGCDAEGLRAVTPSYRPARTPNAFTPDGDGVNDRFFPLLDCPADPYRFAVYNRWGQKVFESFQSGEGWDGTVGGRGLSSDMYIWVLELRDRRDDGEEVSETLKGEVYLMR